MRQVSLILFMYLQITTANTGGILGLCLGFSVLSLLEIVYFITLRLYCQTRRGKMIGHKVTRATQQLWGKAFTAINFMGKIPVSSLSPHEPTTTYPTNVEEYGERVLRNVLRSTKLPAMRNSSNNPSDSKLDTLPYYVENGKSNFSWWLSSKLHMYV